MWWVLLLVTAAEAAAGDTWVMQLQGGASPASVAREMGLKHVRATRIGGVEYHVFEKRNSDWARVSRLANEDTRVLWHERQISRQQTKRSEAVFTGSLCAAGEQTARQFSVTDPLYPQQWHLSRVNAASCWERGAPYRGAGSVVAVVDDGLESRHPDLRSNFAPSLSYSFNEDTASVTPSTGDTHGTAASGVAAASGNDGSCGVGVCPECKVAGIQLIAGPSSDYMEAEALSYKLDAVNVYSNSWGPSDDGYTMTGPGTLTKAALAHNSVSGRSGKGNLYVWAGGNGGHNQDNGNYDGYANSRFTIAVGAIGSDGTKSYYSEECACLMVSAPSSSGSNAQGITTTYLTGSGGFTCTDSFGGTSSAAPLVAGGIALILGRYPALKRRDVLMLLATSSAQVDSTSASWTTRNSAGVAHSYKYGWGMLDMAALSTAADLTGGASFVPTELVCTSGKQTFSYTLGDGVGAFNWPIDVGAVSTPACPIDYVEFVELTVWASHPSRGDFSITLTDPSHVVSALHLPHADHSRFVSGWVYGSARHWGQTLAGIWNVKVADATHNGLTGVLNAIQLTVYGHKKSANRLNKEKN